MSVILDRDDWDLAFAFARGRVGAYRDATGAPATAAADVPRFDHDADGTPLGLLVDTGGDAGDQDRLALDPLILPAALLDFTTPEASDATVFHAFTPLAGGAVVRRAWYTRQAQAAIDAVMRAEGHHRAVGVIHGHRENAGGFVRYRGHAWRLAGLLAVSTAKAAPVLAAAPDKPLIVAGSSPLGLPYG